jgi:membrane protein DedA with SNARE-associated domain
VSEGELTLVGIVAAGVLGNLVGSLDGYGIGYFGRLDLLEHHRLFPVRTFVSVPAGVARMPLARFSLLTTLGSIPWVPALALLGKGVGQNWETWCHHGWWLLHRRSGDDEAQPA